MHEEVVLPPVRPVRVQPPARQPPRVPGAVGPLPLVPREVVGAAREVLVQLGRVRPVEPVLARDPVPPVTQVAGADVARPGVEALQPGVHLGLPGLVQDRRLQRDVDRGVGQPVGVPVRARPGGRQHVGQVLQLVRHPLDARPGDRVLVVEPGGPAEPARRTTRGSGHQTPPPSPARHEKVASSGCPPVETIKALSKPIVPAQEGIRPSRPADHALSRGGSGLSPKADHQRSEHLLGSGLTGRRSRSTLVSPSAGAEATACCSHTAQQTCCAPTAKVGCCGDSTAAAAGQCGCR